LIVITAFISPFKIEREMVAGDAAEGEFYEISSTRRSAPPRSATSRASTRRRGRALKNFTGIDSPYEAPVKPESASNDAKSIGGSGQPDHRYRAWRYGASTPPSDRTNEGERGYSFTAPPQSIDFQGPKWPGLPARWWETAKSKSLGSFCSALSYTRPRSGPPMPQGSGPGQRDPKVDLAMFAAEKGLR